MEESGKSGNKYYGKTQVQEPSSSCGNQSYSDKDTEDDSKVAISVQKILHDAKNDPQSRWFNLEPYLLKQLNELCLEYNEMGLDLTVVIDRVNFTSYIYKPVSGSEGGTDANRCASTKYISIGTGSTQAKSLLSSAISAYDLMIDKGNRFGDCN